MVVHEHADSPPEYIPSKDIYRTEKSFIIIKFMLICTDNDRIRRVVTLH